MFLISWGSSAQGLSRKVGSDIPFPVEDRTKGLSRKVSERLLDQGGGLLDQRRALVDQAGIELHYISASLNFA